MNRPLDRKGITMTQKHLTGTPIHYWIVEKQPAENILFLHAAFADHTSFDEQVKCFAQDYQVLTLDLIGHGKSTVTQKNDGIEKTSEYLRQLLDVEEIDQVHLVGVSIGAVLAQDFANQFPHRVASLCCIGGYDINSFEPSMQKENTGKQMKMMLKALFSIKWFAQSNKMISAATPEAQEKFYQMNNRFQKSSFRYLAGLSKLVNRQKTAPRNYPLLIGCGSEDVPMEIKAAKMWHDSEAQSSLVVFEHAGHLVNMDDPDQFNDVLQQFLTGKL